MKHPRGNLKFKFPLAS